MDLGSTKFRTVRDVVFYIRRAGQRTTYYIRRGTGKYSLAGEAVIDISARVKPGCARVGCCCMFILPFIRFLYIFAMFTPSLNNGYGGNAHLCLGAIMESGAGSDAVSAADMVTSVVGAFLVDSDSPLPEYVEGMFILPPSHIILRFVVHAPLVKPTFIVFICF